MKTKILLLLLLFATGGQAQDSLKLRTIFDELMVNGTCYKNLRVLCKTVGARLSGTPQAERAVQWAQKMLQDAGADNVYLQPVDVPRWIRGNEFLRLPLGEQGKLIEVSMLSLGNTVGTGGKLLTAPVVMVNDYEAFKKLKPADVKDKIVFFNYRFRMDLVNPFGGYGDAGQYRWSGPNWASAKGAAAVIIRSVSTGIDNYPHTGSLRYADTVKPIPAVAIGNLTADRLEEICRKGKVEAQLQSECRMDTAAVRSYNVIGEIKGSEHPDEIVLAGAHLDSWDVGEGAHDDGAGCVQAIEIIRTLKALNIRPKRTIRVVLFMNEENGLKGGVAYADSAKARNEKHILALESDAGGFSPRGIGLAMNAAEKAKLLKHAPLLLPYGIYDFTHEEGGADISPLKKQGVPVSGLLPDPQRYFDLHHSANDVFEQVNHRELKMGAFAMAAWVYLVSEYGL